METFIFRAKSLDNEHSKKGTWVYGNLQKNTDNFGNEKFTIKEIEFNKKSRGWRFYNVDENTIGLKSELNCKNKKKKKAFEGDILSILVDYKYINNGPGVAKKIPIFRKYILKRKKNLIGYSFDLVTKEKIPTYIEIGSKECEIIGNIYENSDLLS